MHMQVLSFWFPSKLQPSGIRKLQLLQLVGLVRFHRVLSIETLFDSHGNQKIRTLLIPVAIL